MGVDRLITSGFSARDAIRTTTNASGGQQSRLLSNPVVPDVSVDLMAAPDSKYLKRPTLGEFRLDTELHERFNTLFRAGLKVAQAEFLADKK